jgi:hypothetical protein
MYINLRFKHIIKSLENKFEVTIFKNQSNDGTKNTCNQKIKCET